jgi:hypothetical protein
MGASPRSASPWPRLHAWAVALVVAPCLAFATAVRAQPCAGFVDVDVSSGFCSSVVWIKDRGVTTGCAVANSYCWADAVSRLQMAAFMYRLGKALSAALFFDQASGAALDLAAPPATVCATADLPVATFNRIVHLAAVMSALTAATNTLRIAFVFSENGGATWSPVPGASTASGTGAWINLTAWHSGVLFVDAGNTMRIGLKADSGVPGGSAVTNWTCQLEVSLFSTDAVH